MVLCYDSQYTRHACAVDAAMPLPARNRTVVALCRRLLQDAVFLDICVEWVKVCGHSTADKNDATVIGNNHTDKAADRGQEGKTKGELAIADYMHLELGS